MHQNAAITSAQNEVYDLFNTIVGLQPRSASGTGASREDILFDLATSIEKKMPGLFDVEAVGMKWPILYEQSMNTVLLEELLRYNPLIEVINTTLPQVKKALRGLVVERKSTRRYGTSLFNQWVPKNVGSQNSIL
jgi:dynein heavy chain